MTIQIIEIKSNKLVAEYTTYLSDLNDKPLEQGIIDSAWESAIKDRIVEKIQKNKYKFIIFP